jgi:hypothetical protein
MLSSSSGSPSYTHVRASSPALMTADLSTVQTGYFQIGKTGNKQQNKNMEYSTNKRLSWGGYLSFDEKFLFGFARHSRGEIYVLRNNSFCSTQMCYIFD